MLLSGDNPQIPLGYGDAAVAAGDEPVQSRAITAGPGADRDGRAQEHHLVLGPDDGLHLVEAGRQVVGIGIVRHDAVVRKGPRRPPPGSRR